MVVSHHLYPSHPIIKVMLQNDRMSFRMGIALVQNKLISNPYYQTNSMNNLNIMSNDDLAEGADFMMVSNENYDSGDIHSDIDEGYDITDRSCAKMEDANDIHPDQSEIKNEYDSTIVSRSKTIGGGSVSSTSILGNNDRQ